MVERIPLTNFHKGAARRGFALVEDYQKASLSNRSVLAYGHVHLFRALVTAFADDFHHGHNHFHVKLLRWERMNVLYSVPPSYSGCKILLIDVLTDTFIMGRAQRPHRFVVKAQGFGYGGGSDNRAGSRVTTLDYMRKRSDISIITELC